MNAFHYNSPVQQEIAMPPPKRSRSRPQYEGTISARTYAVLVQVAKEAALPNPGVALDYIVTDWMHLKQRAIDQARIRAALDEEQSG
jgi:hypothetical protein